MKVRHVPSPAGDGHVMIMKGNASMAKVKRQIITIDEEKCDGCGQCVPSCAEGALRVVDGKARLMKQSFCDGLGACLGECPQGALHVVEMEVEAYDEPAVLGYLQQTAPHMVEKHVAHLRAHGMASSYNPSPVGVAACPSVQVRAWDEGRPTTDEGRQTAAIPLFGWGEEPAAPQPRQQSELRQWPVQLHLVPIQAPFFDGCRSGVDRRLRPVRLSKYPRRLHQGPCDRSRLPQAAGWPGIYREAGANPKQQRCPEHHRGAHGGALLRRARVHRGPGSRSERQRHPAGAAGSSTPETDWLASIFRILHRSVSVCACSPRPAGDEESFIFERETMPLLTLKRICDIVQARKQQNHELHLAEVGCA